MKQKLTKTIALFLAVVMAVTSMSVLTFASNYDFSWYFDEYDSDGDGEVSESSITVLEPTEITVDGGTIMLMPGLESTAYTKTDKTVTVDST